MCFRPPTVDMASPVCPKCGHENFIGVTVCAECGAPMGNGPVGTESADSRDWNAAPTGAAPSAPSAPTPGAPPIPGAPA